MVEGKWLGQVEEDQDENTGALVADSHHHH